MQVSVSFRHMETSPAIQQYASDKLHHIVSKYVVGQDIDSQITFSVERFRHIANFTLNINGLTVKSVEKTEDMYSSIDLALAKLERQIRRYKNKIRQHKPSRRKRPFTMEVVTLNDDSLDSSIQEEPAKMKPVEKDEPPKKRVDPILTLKTETYSATYMTTHEAIMQLNLNEAQFLVFTSKQTERINILYRRDDGNYSLIEAESPTEA